MKKKLLIALLALPTFAMLPSCEREAEIEAEPVREVEIDE